MLFGGHYWGSATRLTVILVILSRWPVDFWDLTLWHGHMLHRDNWDGLDMLLAWNSPGCQGKWWHRGCGTRALEVAPDLLMDVDWRRLWKKPMSTTRCGLKWLAIVDNGEQCWSLCDSFSRVSAVIPGNYSLGLFPMQGKVSIIIIISIVFYIVYRPETSKFCWISVILTFS